jgi:hypothetical protein
MNAPVSLAAVNGTINATQQAGADIGAKVNASCALAGNPGRVLIPPGTYSVSTEINPTSGCEIYGPGATLNGDGLVHNIFHVNGSAGAHVVNVKIRDLTIANGTPSTTQGPTPGMDGIDLDFCDNCRIWNNLIQSIQGQFAIRVTNSQDTRIYDNKIFNYNFEAIAGLTTAVAGPGNVNLWITRNTVDTCTAPAGAGGSCYGISCSGFTTFPLPGPLTQHCFVEQNVVRNIPHWECYDSHGGRDQWFVDNWGENCRFGIQVGAANDFSTTNGVLDGVHIKGNHLNRGSGDPNGYGIVLSGDDVSSKVTNAEY